MDLLKVLSKVNQIEKISFLKILDKYSEAQRDNNTKIDKILSESDNVLKKAGDSNVVELFYLLRDDYTQHLSCELRFNDHQLDLIAEIFVRDGNQMMTKDWFYKLYKRSLISLKKQTKKIEQEIKNDKSELPPERKRDYTLYQNCVRTAYTNDSQINREQHISWEEKTILQTLSKGLGLSAEEEKAITYSVVPPAQHNVDDIVNALKEAGIVFFNRKTNTLYVPDEIVYLLRKILEIELPYKYLRRILNHLRDPEINLIAKRHNIVAKLSRAEKIQEILNQGVNVTALLSDDIFQDKIHKSERAKRLQDLIAKDLDIQLPKMGRSLEERVALLLDHLRNQEQEDSTSLSRDGFNKLLSLLIEFKPEIDKIVKAEFELQDDGVIQVEFLNDYGIGPRDLLYLLQKQELIDFCKLHSINSRGNHILNIINNFRNIKDLYLDNFIAIGNRDLNYLKEIGLDVKESELGSIYENLTEAIFINLGFNVNNKLKDKINTSRSRMDLLIDLGNKDVIVVECKSIKDKDYNKYAAVSRQLKAYENLCYKNQYNVTQVILVSNDFSEDFISECEYDPDLDISLLTSGDLVKIHEGLKEANMDELPVRLITKGGALNGDRIVKALNR
jgi:hypothetical protein